MLTQLHREDKIIFDILLGVVLANPITLSWRCIVYAAARCYNRCYSTKGIGIHHVKHTIWHSLSSLSHRLYLHHDLKLVPWCNVWVPWQASMSDSWNIDTQTTSVDGVWTKWRMCICRCEDLSRLSADLGIWPEGKPDREVWIWSAGECHRRPSLWGNHVHLALWYNRLEGLNKTLFTSLTVTQL